MNNHHATCKNHRYVYDIPDKVVPQDIEMISEMLTQFQDVEIVVHSNDVSRRDAVGQHSRNAIQQQRQQHQQQQNTLPNNGTTRYNSMGQERPNFHCTLCSKSFIHKSDFRRHKRKVHREHRTYSCYQCHEVFQHEHELVKHLATGCDIKPNVLQLNGHVSVPGAEILIEVTEDEEEENTEASNVNIPTRSSGSFDTKNESKEGKFASKTNLKPHMHQRSVEAKTFTCYQCYEAFHHKQDLIDHWSRDCSAHSQEVPRSQNKSAQDENQNNQNDIVRHEAEAASSRRETLSIPMEHLGDNTLVPNGEIQIEIDEEDEDNSPDNSNTTPHQNAGPGDDFNANGQNEPTSHEEERRTETKDDCRMEDQDETTTGMNGETDPPPDEPQQRFRCKICDETFIEKSAAKDHVYALHRNGKRRTKKTTYKCCECNKKFNQKLDLINHWQEECGGSASYSPPSKIKQGIVPSFPNPGENTMGPVEEKWRRKEENLDDSAHQKKDFPCIYCGEVFDEEYQCEKHKHRVHNKKRLYKCYQCNVYFKHRTELSEHWRNHEQSSAHPAIAGRMLTPPYNGVKQEAPSPYNGVDDYGFDGMAEQKPFKTEHLETTKRKRAPGEKRFKCDKCDKAFAYPGTLEKHMKTHKVLQCKICLQSFNGRGEFLTHTRTHRSDKTYKCEYCDKTFAHHAKWLSHMKMHSSEKPFHCTECSESFVDKLTLSNHMEEAHVDLKPYKCEHCGKFFARKAYLAVHLRVHSGEKPFKCSYCGKAFTTFSTLTTHVRLHTGEKPYKCLVCNKSFIQKSQYYYHSRIHTGEKPFKCDQCEKSYRDRETLVEHMRLHTGEKPYQCDQCDKTFHARSALSTHRMMHTNERPHQCVKCKKTFIFKSALNIHMRIHMEKPYKCNICKRTFTTSPDLKEHARLHSKEKPYKCNQCSKSFFTKYMLDSHMQKHIDGEAANCLVSRSLFGGKTSPKKLATKKGKVRRHQCNLCDKAYVNLVDLTDHMLKHMGEKPYECNLCGRRFSWKSGFTLHRQRHHKDAKRYQCQRCQKGFATISLLKRHVEEQCETYKCGTCEKSFDTKSSLDEHSRTHEAKEESHFQCKYCVKSYTDEETLRRHMRKHKRKLSSDKCYQCDKTFNHRVMLAMHMDTHSDPKLYQCKLCEETFDAKSDLKEHKLTHREQDVFM